jgi:hypothetical protein
MKRQLVLMFTCATLALVACDDDVSSAQKGADNEESSHMLDTLYLSNKDTVIIKDSIFVRDSAGAMDTVVLKDTVYVIDSLTKDDSSCEVTDQGASFKIQCKDKVPYILNKATCNGKAYDPSIDLCLDSTIHAIADADTCKGVIYDSRESFCSASEKVVAKCGGKNYDADNLFCYFDEETKEYSTPKRCSGLEYDINQYECEKGMVIGYCGETKYNTNAVTGCEDGKLRVPIKWIDGIPIALSDCIYGANPITGFCLINNNCKRFDWDECAECEEGFTGENCSKCTTGHYGNQCLPVTCQHGTPNDGIHGDGHCLKCDPGYYGLDCKSNNNDCSGHGTVIDGPYGNGACICQAGYVGENCEFVQQDNP